MMESEKRDELKILILTGLVVLGVTAFGVLGYMFIERWNFLDSLYQTVITISTVGFGEVNPISTGGRILTILLILFTVTLFGYSFTRFVTVMVEGRIKVIMKGRKMENKIAKLSSHYIICGFGRMGNQVAQELLQAKVPFVVLDTNPAAFECEDAKRMLWIVGDACREEDLDRCQIRKAKGLVSVLAEDEHNVYTVLTARGMNEKLLIVTRATQNESEHKLRRAGADHIISPFKIGGSRIASMILFPSLTQFIDGLAQAEDIRLTMIEVTIREDSPQAGKTIGATGITGIEDSIIIGLSHPGESIDIRPPIESVLTAGDRLILMGRMDAIRQVEELMNAPA